jgi:uncharacterized integral membrane protein
LLLVLAATFAVENGEDVTLRYYFGLQSHPIPLFLLILLSVVLGILIALAFLIRDHLNLRREIRQRDSALRSLSVELQTLKQSRVENQEMEESF